MSRMEKLSPKIEKLPVRRCRISNTRVFFNFESKRVFAETYIFGASLVNPFNQSYLEKIKNKDLNALGKLIGKILADMARRADELKISIRGKNIRFFNFFAGETEGKRVVLIEFFK